MGEEPETPRERALADAWSKLCDYVRWEWFKCGLLCGFMAGGTFAALLILFLYLVR